MYPVDGPCGARDPARHPDQGPVLVALCSRGVQPGLHATHAGTEYFFCGKGCTLEFGDDPERFLDSAYVPSM